MSAVVGMAVFMQYWYWFPLLHFLSLALHPTALVGLTRDLRIPKSFSATCHAKPSLFAYPTPIEDKKAEAKSSVAKVELSVTVKARQKARKRALRRARSQRSALTRAGSAATDISSIAEELQRAPSSSSVLGQGQDDEDGTGPSSSSAAAAAAATDGEEGGAKDGAAKKKDKKKESEPTSFTLSNPTRVTSSQRRFVQFKAAGERYVPLRADLSLNLGVVMLRDTDPGAPDTNVDSIRPPNPTDGTDEDFEPPEPFEWIIDDE